MKRYILLAISLVLLFASSQINGQVLITKNDSIPLGQDSIVKIVLPEARGNIQWQKSLDSKSWIDIEGKTNDTISVKTDTEAIYRAIVTDGTCLPVISDSVGVVTADSITKNYVNPITLGLELVSDSTDISNGNYIYTGTDNTNDFEIGKVIIDEQSGGSIRKITEIIQNGDTVVTQTEQATMEDLFYGTSFKLSTAMVYPSENLKSATLTDIEKLLTDENGFIHPVEVIYESPDGTRLKSASIYTENENTLGGTLYMHKDWSGLTFYDLTGTFSLPNKNGVIVSYSGNVKSYISEGYFTFDPEFKFEFEFDRPKINWKNFKVSKGEIKKFKFYSDKSLIDFKNILVFESNVAYEFGKEWSLVPDFLKSKLKFIVGGVPFWIEIKIDIKSSLTVDFGGGSITTHGFQNTNYITIGAGYENNNWYTIKDIERENKVFPSNSGFIQSGIRFDIYPSVEMKIYSIVGPYFKVGPYMDYEANLSLAENWDKKIDIGVDANVGVSVDVFGKEIASLNAIDWNFFNTNLWKAPRSLSLESGNNQSSQTGNVLPIPIQVKVTDSKNQRLNDVQVHFNPLKGSVSKSVVKTDYNGYAETFWTLSANAGEHTMTVYLLDGKDQQIDGCSLTVKATATAVSTNLPTVTTTAITAITQTNATSGGNVTSDGGAPVTARGVCWSTSPNPTIANSKTTNGTGTGSFTSSLTGLTANTPYYVRAYATNSAGTAYGNEVTFTTTDVDGPVYGSFTDTRDGHVYKTVTIGDQVWLAENLAYLPVVSPPVEGSNTEPFYYVYDYVGSDVETAKLQDNYELYGVLYNWYAAITASPPGWHLPTDEEWKQLEMTLGMSQEEADNSGWRGTDQGLQMKATIGWNDNGNGTNTSGFSALPGGLRFDDGKFSKADLYGAGSAGTTYWSSSEYDTSFAFYRWLGNGYGSINRGGIIKQIGFSIRCIKGEVLSTVTTSTPTNITATSVDLGGNITSEGGATVTERGIVYNTSTNPTTNNNKVIIGSGTGTFNSTISGLIPNTPYYVRAYATNSQGTAYGNEVTFTTTDVDGPVYGSFTDTRDGHVYKTVTIGNQVWLAENLAYLPAISPSSAGSETEPYYYVYDYEGTDMASAKNNANYATYGVLYNWTAAMVACPPGWHLPTDAEWTELENYLIANGYNYDGTTNRE
jgi:uncharacterized protein (TIGR02145 family)